MPRPRFENLEPERRRAILDAAAAEFAARGYDGASLNAILQSVGLSKGAFYYYFDDKADLYVSVFAALEQEMLEGVPGLLEPPTREGYWGMFHRKIELVFSLLDERPWLLTIGSTIRRISDDARSREPIASLAQRFDEQMLDFLELGQTLGAVRTDVPRRLLLDLVTAMDRALSEWLSAHHGELDREALRRLFDTLIQMFTAFTAPPGVIPPSAPDRGTP